MSTEIRYFENRKDWRKWLADNFDTADGVWFVFPTKSSSEKSIVYKVLYIMTLLKRPFVSGGLTAR